jgi:vacuolar-type H+-ATPase subunit E/Vma4
MSPLRVDEARVALQPLRRELLRRARSDADSQVAAAREDAAATLARAHARAADLLATARSRGEQRAEAELAAGRAAARHARRAEILEVQRDAFEQLRAASRAAVCGLRDEPGYPLLRENLRRTAKDLLGPDAAITDDPAGGIVAAADGRRIELTLPALADRALDAAAAEIGGLWT